jgi:hypothetical protein
MPFSRLEDRSDRTARTGGIGDQVTVGMIVDDLGAALEQFCEIANDVGGEEIESEKS